MFLHLYKNIFKNMHKTSKLPKNIKEEEEEEVYSPV